MIRRTLALCLLATLLPIAPVQAEKNTPAAKAFAEGQRLYKQADYLGAIAAFKRSYSLHPHFLTLCNIARAYERRSDMVQAALHYERCLKEGGAGSPKAAEMKEALKNVKSTVAQITVESPGNPPAQVFVDGAPAGRAPIRLLLNPGPHDVEVRRPGARANKATIQADIGEQRTMVLHTSPDAGPIPEGGTGTDLGHADKPAKKRGLAPVWFWSATGLTAALAIVATALGVKTLTANNAYEDDPTEDHYNSVLDYRLYTNIFWGITAASAAGTTLLFFYTDFRGSSREQNQAFVIGVQGRF